jgi:hypothetical protein
MIINVGASLGTSFLAAGAGLMAIALFVLILLGIFYFVCQVYFWFYLYFPQEERRRRRKTTVYAVKEISKPSERKH